MNVIQKPCSSAGIRKLKNKIKEIANTEQGTKNAAVCVLNNKLKTANPLTPFPPIFAF
jgi:hypothetical protein